MVEPWLYWLCKRKVILMISNLLKVSGVWKVSMFHTHFSQNYNCSCLPEYHVQIRDFKVLFQMKKEKPLKVLTTIILKVS